MLDLGSISAAATVLGYTQSAVSQQLAALEREAGAALVDRSQRPLRPTGAGAALRPHVERVLAAVTSADAVVEGLRGAGIPRVRLIAFASALSSFVPAALRDLRRSRDVVVQVLQLETHEALEQLRAGRADIAVVHHMPGIAVPETAGFQRRALLLDDLHVVVPERHRLAQRDTISIAELEGETLILPPRNRPAGRFRAVVEHLCAQAGFTPRVGYEMDDLPAVQAFAAAGIAIVPMHGLTLATLPQGVVARPLAERPAGSRTVEALAPADAPSVVVDDLLERLSRAAQGYAGQA